MWSSWRLGVSLLILFKSVVVVLGDAADDEGPTHDPVSGDYAYKPSHGFLPEEDVALQSKIQCGEDFEHPWLKMPIPEIITSSGYDFEEISVMSKDGYYVTSYRIPGGELSPKKKGKIPVILNHGSIGNAMSWLFFQGNDSLAFKLANSGYDVFLMNARGSKVSQKHKSLSIKDAEYWKFTFEEMAIYDIPALMDRIIKITGMENMYYIGHSQATIQYSIMLAERPELAKKIRVGFLLAPAPHITGMTNMGLRLMLTVPAKEEVWKLIHGKSMGEADILKLMKGTCILKALDCQLCENAFFYLFGYNPKQVNGTIAALARDRYFDTSGTKVMVHLAQFMQSDEFKRYDYMDIFKNTEKYGSPEVPKYKMKKITAPTVMWWGYSDQMVVKEAVKKTYQAYSKGVIKEHNRVQVKSWDHMDFLYGKDANRLVYDRILWLMDKKKYVKQKDKKDLSFLDDLDPV